MWPYMARHGVGIGSGLNFEREHGDATRADALQAPPGKRRTECAALGIATRSLVALELGE